MPAGTTMPAAAKQRVSDQLPHQKLTFLLVALLLLLVGSAGQTSQGPPWVQFTGTLTLAAGLHAITSRKRWRGALLLAVPALAANGLNVLTHLQSRPLMLMEGGFSILFLAYVVGVILSYVLAETEVMPDTINGALCGYLLLGAIWANAYGMIELLAPGAFMENVKVAAGVQGEFGEPGRLFPRLYYSFITLTSVGYGDIVPVATAARALSVLEALVGQIYMIVLVSRLVGIHIAQQMARQP
jgi:hypothetical protein